MSTTGLIVVKQQNTKDKGHKAWKASKENTDNTWKGVTFRLTTDLSKIKAEHSEISSKWLETTFNLVPS